MKASARTQAIGCDDGKHLTARCPLDWDLSAPQALREESALTVGSPNDDTQTGRIV